MCGASVCGALGVQVSCADTQWCGLGVQVAGSRRPSGGERTSGGLGPMYLSHLPALQPAHTHRHNSIAKGQKKKEEGARAGEIGNPINCIDS